MRILYILSGTGTKGGATKSFLSMADHVAEAGNEIAVVVPNQEGITPLLRKRGWTVFVTPYEHCCLPRISWNMKDIVGFFPRLIRKAYLNLGTRRRVMDFARKWKPDLIHDNTSVDDFGHYVAKSIGVPHIIHVREYGWKDFRLRLPGLKQRISYTEAYTVAITSDLASFRGKESPEGHVRTIYNGVIRSVSDKYIYEKKPYFLYAGRITASKGVDDLVSAYAEYASSEIKNGRTPLRLTLAGAYIQDVFFVSLKKKISLHGLDGYVDWLGSVDNLETYYSEAAATVIPSRYEGFGRVMPEAMSAGCLCIARNSGGLAEQLENGRKMMGREIGYCFETVEELKSRLTLVSHEYHIGNAYNKDGLFKTMIDNSRSVVGALYTFEANGRNIIQLYSDILHDRESEDRRGIIDND